MLFLRVQWHLEFPNIPQKVTKYPSHRRETTDAQKYLTQIKHGSLLTHRHYESTIQKQ